MKEVSLPEIDGVLGTIKNSASFLKRKSLEFKNAIVFTISNAGNIIENLLKLIFLYVCIFFDSSCHVTDNNILVYSKTFKQLI